MITSSRFEYKRYSSDGGIIQLVSELLTSRIRHPSIFLSITDILAVSFWGVFFLSILSLSKLNMKSCPSCVVLWGMNKSLPLKFTFTSIIELLLLYLGANLVFNYFDTKKSSLKYIFALHFFMVGFLMIEFTDTYLQRPKEGGMDSLLDSLSHVVHVTSEVSVPFKLLFSSLGAQFMRIESKGFS